MQALQKEKKEAELASAKAAAAAKGNIFTYIYEYLYFLNISSRSELVMKWQKITFLLRPFFKSYFDLGEFIEEKEHGVVTIQENNPMFNIIIYYDYVVKCKH